MELSNVIGRFTSFALKAGTVVAAIASIALGLLYKKQNSLLYFPVIGGLPRRPHENPRGYRNPGEYELPYESHLISTADGATIHSYLMLHPTDNKKNFGYKPFSSNIRPTILFFHGNAGNIGLRLPNALKMYHKLQANILLVEYRGYGDSSDHPPTEEGLKLDSEAALNFIRDYYNDRQMQPYNSQLFVFGRSLGGAVAFHLAHHAQRKGIPLAGLIVENTFLSIGKMVDVLMPMVAPFKSLILRIDWDSASIAQILCLPVLYLAGSADELVPHSHMKSLYRYSKAPIPASLTSKSTVVDRRSLTRMHIIRNGKHNESWLQGGTRYWETIKKFMMDANPPTPSTTPTSPAASKKLYYRSNSRHSLYQKTDSMNNAETENMMNSITISDDVLESSTSSLHNMNVNTALEIELASDDSSDAVNDSKNVASSIPIMPGNLMNIAKQATGASISTAAQSKKTKLK